MPVSEITSGGNGTAFLVSAGIVYEIIAACCSSPQTAEINITKRASTLMKWVNIGLMQAVLFVVIACLVDRRQCGAIIAGGALAAVVMYLSYWLAAKWGQAACDEPTTESY